MRDIILNNGIKMPILGYGVYLIKPKDTKDLVLKAIRAGYRHIDTAQYYKNEEGVGNAIRESGIDRSEFFVTTKTMTKGYNKTKKGLEESLKKFGYPYFDLVLLHWPMGDDLGAYKALEEAYKEGKVKAIGLSNFNSRQFLEIYNNSEIKPMVNQIETHLLFQQRKMHEFLTKYNCVHEAYSPLGADLGNLFEHPIVKSIAKKHNRSTAQIMLKYLVDLDIVVIPKSSHENRIIDNFNIFDINLDEEDNKLLKSIDTGKFITNWPKEMMEEFY